MTKQKKISLILIYVSIVISIFLFGIFYAVKKPVQASEQNNSQDLSNRIKEYLKNDDLYYAYIKGEVKETQLIAFHEVGFNKSDHKILKYHFYLYVPKKHKLQEVQKDLEMRYFNNRVITLSGQIVEKNEVDRFYLVEMICRHDFDAQHIIEKGIEKGYREYVLGYIPWRYDGVDYQPENVDRKYIYKGYEKGLDESSKEKSTLTASYESTKYLDLGVHPACYTAKGLSDANARYQLHSVYFSIPRYIEDEYGYLKKIKASFYETRLAPVLFTESDLIYNDFKARQDNKYKAIKGKNGAVLYTSFVFQGIGYGVELRPTDGYAFDLDKQWDELTNKEGNFSISGVQKARINSKTKYNGYERNFSLVKKGKIDWRYREYAEELIKEFGLNPKDMPQSETTAEDEHNKRTKVGHRVKEYINDEEIKTQSYGEKTNWFQRFKALGFMHPDVTSKVDVKETIKKVEDDILSSDAEEKYKVDSYYLEKLRKFYLKKKALLENTYLLRYAVRKIEYKEDLRLFKTVSDYDGRFEVHTNPKYGYGEGKATIVNLPMFLDFNIISLTFKNQKGETEIYVKSSPINTVGDLIGPPKRDKFLGIDWGKNLKQLKRIFKIIGIVLAVLMLIVIASLIAKFVPKGDQHIKVDLPKNRYQRRRRN